VKEYNPQAIEPKWQKYWEDNKTFKTKSAKPGEKKCYVLDMFPYPSGKGLHVGHPLGYTATDIYARMKRMQGYSVLHPMGYDAFGLPAEQHAVSTGEHPAKITEENCKVFTSQSKKVGLSYDWDRNLATCTPDYYKWTQWIFLQIYNSWFDDELQKARPINELPIPADVKEQGELAIQEYQASYRLAFYTDANVNWCPALGTVLANEEVIEGRSERGGHEVIRKPMKQWMLRITKYTERLLSGLEEINWPENIKEQQRNWIGKRFGTEIDFTVEGSDEVVTAFTTRPDTLCGVTFFVVSPEHPLVDTITTDEYREKVVQYREHALRMSDFLRTIENRKKTGEFTGGFVVNPINSRKIPVYVGDYVLMSYGTGAVMGVPAHDERDFEFARMFQLEILPVIAPSGESEDVMNAVLDAEIVWTGPGNMLPCNDSALIDEPLEGQSNEDAKKIISSWLENRQSGRVVHNYKLRDWLFSRQRYWGEPIPIIHWDDGTLSALDESELPLELPNVEDYKPSEGGESPLAKASDWLVVKDPVSGKTGRRETNTMPQWAGSCWYYLRFIDPKNSEAGWDRELEKGWMPVDLYVGGAEHAVLHLLYSRFWHKVLYDLGHVSTSEPFHRLFNQGMLQAAAFKNKRGSLIPVDEVQETEDGKSIHVPTGDEVEKISAKMSKSLRNVVTVDQVVADFGADTYRMYLMFMGPLDSSRPWDSKAIMGNRRFLNKVWAFVTGGAEEGFREVITEAQESAEVKRAINLAVKKVSEDIEEFRFNTAISCMMEALNTMQSQEVSKPTLEKLVLILSTFAPHMGEELWSRLGNSDTLAYESWPSFDENLIKEQAASVVIQVNGKKRSLIEVDPEISQEDLKKAIIEEMKGTDYEVSSDNKFITVFRPGTSIPRLVNIIKK